MRAEAEAAPLPANTTPSYKCFGAVPRSESSPESPKGGPRARAQVPQQLIRNESLIQPENTNRRHKQRLGTKYCNSCLTVEEK